MGLIERESRGCWVKENFALCNHSYLLMMLNVIGRTASCGTVFGNVSVLEYKVVGADQLYTVEARRI